MNANDTVLKIVAVVMGINAIDGDRIFHVEVNPHGVNITAFDRDRVIEWQQLIYNFEPAYWPRLRKVCHDLEQAFQEALNQHRESAA